MGSPLSPIVANLFMEDFEEKTINSFPHKPRWWLRFVDDVFSNWPHGEDKLEEFQSHINNQCDSIKFTLEKEEENSLPFLDVLITKNPDGSLSLTGYTEIKHIQIDTFTPTHTIIYPRRLE